MALVVLQWESMELGLLSLRVAKYQVPVEISPNRATSLDMRWLMMYSRTRPGKSMRERLANEIIDAANERGESVKKREDTHRMAEANKAFAHYRW